MTGDLSSFVTAAAATRSLNTSDVKVEATLTACSATILSRAYIILFPPVARRGCAWLKARRSDKSWKMRGNCSN